MSHNDKEIQKIAKYFRSKGYEVRSNAIGNIIKIESNNDGQNIRNEFEIAKFGRKCS